MNDVSALTLRFLVEGPSACFRRPEFVEDFVSYDVITPLAARRIIRATFLPDATLTITRISVLRPISFADGTIDGQRFIGLRDVSYIIDAKITARDRAFVNGVHSMETRQTYLGLRTLSGTVRRLRDDERVTSALDGQLPVDLGWMVHDVTGRGRARARFYRPTMVGGVIDVVQSAMAQLAG